jgi:glycosyltransferase involved in cell wall biosynthesis
MSKALVSVIVPAYKMGQFIGEALASVGAQTYPHWELIVVDDAGPEDGTRAAAEALAVQHVGHRVEYMRHETNQGVSAARNTAMASAKGDLFAFLDPDDEWRPQYLTRMVAVLERERNATAVSARWWERKGAEPIDRRSKPCLLEEWQTSCFPASLSVKNFIAPSAVVARAERVRALGGFDTAPHMQHVEDYDLWIRMIEAGERIFLLNEALINYRSHEGAATHTVERVRPLIQAITAKHPFFFTNSLRSLVLNLYVRHESLKSVVKNPLARLWRRLLG